MIRSKRSPATASKRLPSRASTFVNPFIAAFTSVKASARGLMSVATTCEAWRAASSACTPLPVPMSRTRAPRTRGVRQSHTREVSVYAAT